MTPPHLRPALEFVAAHGPRVAPLLAVGCAGLLWRERRRAEEPPAAPATAERGAASLLFLAFCALVVLVSTVLFVGMLWVLKVRLPFGRTALVLVSPLTLLFSGVALTEGYGVWGRARSSLGVAAVALVAVAFLAALRFESFTEWSYDADVREAISVAGPYMKAQGLRRIGITWQYRSTGNYYRTYLGFDFDPLENDRDEELIDGYDIYFVEPANAAFVDSRKLRVIYEGPISGMRVAVRDQGRGGRPADGSPGCCTRTGRVPGG